MSQNHGRASRLASEKVVIQAPMSFVGSAKRIWKITEQENQAVKYGLMVLATVLVALAWCVIVAWYMFFGLLVFPFRLLRRGSRKRKKQELQHREQLAAIESLKRSQSE
jgi:hypothetical protein